MTNQSDKNKTLASLQKSREETKQKFSRQRDLSLMQRDPEALKKQDAEFKDTVEGYKPLAPQREEAVNRTKSEMERTGDTMEQYKQRARDESAQGLEQQQDSQDPENKINKEGITPENASAANEHLSNQNTQPESPKSKSGQVKKASGQGAKAAGTGMKVAGKGVQVAGKGVEVAGKGLEVAGKGLDAAGKALSATKLGAIVGVPLSAVGKLAGLGGKGAKATGKGVDKAGKGVEKAGKKIEKAGDKVKEKGKAQKKQADAQAQQKNQEENPKIKATPLAQYQQGIKRELKRQQNQKPETKAQNGAKPRFAEPLGGKATGDINFEKAAKSRIDRQKPIDEQRKKEMEQLTKPGGKSVPGSMTKMNQAGARKEAAMNKKWEKTMGGRATSKIGEDAGSKTPPGAPSLVQPKGKGPAQKLDTVSPQEQDAKKRELQRNQQEARSQQEKGKGLKARAAEAAASASQGSKAKGLQKTLGRMLKGKCCIPVAPAVGTLIRIILNLKGMFMIPDFLDEFFKDKGKTTDRIFCCCLGCSCILTIIQMLLPFIMVLIVLFFTAKLLGEIIDLDTLFDFITQLF